MLGTGSPLPTPVEPRALRFLTCVSRFAQYGVTDSDHFPSTGSRYDISISSGDEPFPAPWLTKWNPLLENGWCANCTMTETHNATSQHVVWEVTPFHPKEGAARGRRQF